jgi:predicted acetyltransferase
LWVSTQPAFRRQGFATCVMERIHGDAQNEGIDYSVLMAWDHVVPFYEALGYNVLARYGKLVRENENERSQSSHGVD